MGFRISYILKNKNITSHVQKELFSYSVFDKEFASRKSLELHSDMAHQKQSATVTENASPNKGNLISANMLFQL